MPLKILIIDDEESSVIPVRDELDRLPDAECTISGFDSAMTEIASFQPDVIVLDLMKNQFGELQVNEGASVGLRIWNERFCPLIYYTASDENPDEHGHPLVAVVRKGSGSEEQVREKIQVFLPHIAALEKVNAEIGTAVRRALRESKPRVFAIDSAKQESQVLTRSIRRRVAASMDDALAQGEPNVMSWEVYLCPPSIPQHLLTGDILRVAGGDKKDPTSYRVVLTPSCDLVKSDTREPKVQTVLVARCTRVDRLLEDLNLQLEASPKPTAIKSAKKKLAKFLAQGFGHSAFPVASLPGEFPAMAADFRSLEVISIKQLSDPVMYDRVASVDAPFRELFVWAYLSAVGRPAMPDRDFETWAEDIIAAVQTAATATGLQTDAGAAEAQIAPGNPELGTDASVTDNQANVLASEAPTQALEVGTPAPEIPAKVPVPQTQTPVPGFGAGAPAAEMERNPTATSEQTVTPTNEVKE